MARKKRDHAKRYYWILAIGVVSYLLLTYFAPIRMGRFELSVTQIRLIQVSFVIPIITIWFAAFYGAIKFKHYSHSIIKSPDGKALNQVSNGLLLLATSLIIGSLFSSLRSYIEITDVDSLKLFTIINNYLQIGLPLMAFLVMFGGSQKLLDLINLKRPKASSAALVLAGSILVVALYALFFLNNEYRNATPDPARYASYYLPDLALMLTVWTPIVIYWGVSLFVVLDLRAYVQLVKGTIYKEAMSRLVRGIIAVTLFSVSLQFLSTAGSIFANIGLEALLGIIYLILIAYAAGYLYIASGAKKLTKIEEV